LSGAASDSLMRDPAAGQAMSDESHTEVSTTNGSASRESPPSAGVIGERLRLARTSSGIGVRELSRRIGVTGSMVSQMERGAVMPSVGTLYAIVRELGLSFDDLFDTSPASGTPAPRKGNDNGHRGEIGGHGPVQRHYDRKALLLDTGVRWELLTTQEDPHVDFLFAVYPPGSTSTPEDALTRHGGKEYGLVQSGRLGVTVGFESYELAPGDSISFDSSVPHRLWAVGDEAAEVIWFVTDRRAYGASSVD
jgi:transcriptional regulator with XRE-family HTH domain